MHVPDAEFSPQVAVITGGLEAGGLFHGPRKRQPMLRERTTVLMGSMSAFVFAAQMVNFPLY